MAQPQRLSRDEIGFYLPHGGQWLLLDEVDFLGDDWGKSQPAHLLSATWTVRPEVCEGHFPGQPILPGIIWQEIANQAAAMAYALSRGEPVTGKYVQTTFARVAAPAVPGDLVTVQVTRMDIGRIKIEFSVSGYVGTNFDQPAFSSVQICALDRSCVRHQTATVE